jgi:hypothetical protein
MKKKLSKDKIRITKINEKLELASKYRDFLLRLISTRRYSDEDYDFILDNSGILQNYMLKYGLGLSSYRPPFASYVMKNYQIIANFPNILRNPRQYCGSIDPMDWFIQIQTSVQMYIQKLKDELENTSTIPSQDEINEVWLGSLTQLENSLVEAIYDDYFKHPTFDSPDSRHILDRIKRKVKREDENICQICLEKYEEVELEIDHIYPHSLGGTNEAINLMALCKKCNQDKSNRLDFFRSEDGKEKLKDNIRKFVLNTTIISNFGKWLRDSQKESKRKEKSTQTTQKKKK